MQWNLASRGFEKTKLLKRGMCLITTFLAVAHLLLMLYYKNWLYTLKLADLLFFLMAQYHFGCEILKSERSGEKHFSSEHVTVHDKWSSDYASVHMYKWGHNYGGLGCVSVCLLLHAQAHTGEEWLTSRSWWVCVSCYPSQALWVVVTSAGTLVVCLCWNWPEPGKAVGWLVRTRWQLVITYVTMEVAASATSTWNLALFWPE